MDDQYAIIVVIEDYHDSKKLHKVSFAIDDGNEIRNALLNIGYKDENISLLSNNYATKTAILEKVKTISKYAQKGERILFYYSGHGVYADSKNFLTCVDSQMSAVNDTCISIQDILGLFNKSASKKIMLFLDCCHSGIEFDTEVKSPVSAFSTDDLRYQYANVEYLTGFAACKGDEKSRPDQARSHGVWSYYLIQALNGDADKLYKNGLLFSDELQSYLSEQTLLRVKLITTDKVAQTPIKFGKETDKFIVADVSHILAQKQIEISSSKIKFENVTILTSEEGYVRSLPGFIKGKHKTPQEVSSYCDSWIKKIAYVVLDDEINKTATKIRSILGFKRKDIFSANVDDGIGEIVTKEFDYLVVIHQHEEDAGSYVLTRSIENFKNSSIIYTDKFNDLFSECFDELTFRTRQRINIEKIIDAIEDIDDEDIISVVYSQSETSRCSIIIPSIDMTVELTTNTVTIKADQKQSPLELIDVFKTCIEQLTAHNIPKLLK